MRVLTRLRFPAVSTAFSAQQSQLGLTITDPLHIYRSLVDKGTLAPDPNQYRAAIVIQGVYERLLDYKPERYHDLRERLDAVTTSLRSLEISSNYSIEEDGEKYKKPKSWRDNTNLPKILQSAEAQTRSLVQVLSKDDDLLNLDSPRGLLLSGSVGCGKSMLADLLAASLPYAQKQRVHFDAFMLSIYAQLEDHRKRMDLQDTYSILHVARELVSRSTILFLDEFQLPDKASGKILKNLFCNFFQLGGVLIATSNRLPENLVDAEWRRDEFGIFEDVLRNRCEIWDMRSNVDWRRKSESGRMVTIPPTNVSPEHNQPDITAHVPKNYFLLNGDSDISWGNTVDKASSGIEEDWKPQTLVVYGRDVVAPRCRNGIAYFSFDELCVKNLGPADYISIASHFPTIIVDRVPPLTSKSHRHEAKRFILLLDAIYECRCKLLMRAETPIEDLFFPDAVDTSETESSLLADADSIHSEAFAEAYQDLTMPFRPNVSLYEQALVDPDDLTSWRKRKYNFSDQDADFATKADFMKIAKYTGEDEKFSFKRAVSRVWEVCGEKWWDDLSTMTIGQRMHSPLPLALRRWERQSDLKESTSTRVESRVSNYDKLHDQKQQKRGNVATPEREDPPKFESVHIWGVVDSWGKRAGKWGQGVNAFKDNGKQQK